MTPLLLSKRKAAQLLGVGRCNTLEQMIAAGTIRPVLVNGRVRIPLAEVERIATEGTEPMPVKRKREPQRARSRADAEADALAAMKF